MQLAKYTNNEFTVKESTTTNLLIGLFFLVLFLFVLTNFLSDTRSYNDDKRNNLYAIISMTLLPAIIFLIKSYLNQTIMTVNKDGFYYLGILKTNWANFISAEVTEEEKVGSYQDNFVFILQFYKPGEEGYFVTKIPLKNTLDKSGEEIIAAIKHFKGQEVSTA
jgi:hypothetical protein